MSSQSISISISICIHIFIMPSISARTMMSLVKDKKGKQLSNNYELEIGCGASIVVTDFRTFSSHKGINPHQTDIIEEKKLGVLLIGFNYWYSSKPDDEGNESSKEDNQLVAVPNSLFHVFTHRLWTCVTYFERRGESCCFIGFWRYSFQCRLHRCAQ